MEGVRGPRRLFIAIVVVAIGHIVDVVLSPIRHGIMSKTYVKTEQIKHVDSYRSESMLLP